MKTKLINFGRACWQMLSEVPGWPDAPKWMRWRRSLPMVLPCVSILLMLSWNAVIRDPQVLAERLMHQNLYALEEEIESLRLGCSEQKAAELTVKSAAADSLLLQGPADLGPLLLELKKVAGDWQWEANFQAADTSNDTAEADAQILFLPVRGRLTTATAVNPRAFASLLTLLERFSSSPKRIDLIRVAIRADEQGRYNVELNLRLASRLPHEKVVQ